MMATSIPPSPFRHIAFGFLSRGQLVYITTVLLPLIEGLVPFRKSLYALCTLTHLCCNFMLNDNITWSFSCSRYPLVVVKVKLYCIFISSGLIDKTCWHMEFWISVMTLGVLISSLSSYPSYSVCLGDQKRNRPTGFKHHFSQNYWKQLSLFSWEHSEL